VVSVSFLLPRPEPLDFASEAMLASRAGDLALTLATVVVFAHGPWWPVAATEYSLDSLYTSSSCFEASWPSTIFVLEDASCDAIATTCSVTTNSTSYYYETVCSEDYEGYLSERFPTGDYLLEHYYNSDAGCFNWYGLIAYPVDNKCHPGTIDGSYSVRTVGNSDGSVTLEFFYNSSTCEDTAFSWSQDISQDSVAGSTCQPFPSDDVSVVTHNSYSVISIDTQTDWNKAITEAKRTSSSGSGDSGSTASVGSGSLTAGSIDVGPIDNSESGSDSASTTIGIVVGIVVALLVVIGILFCCYRRKKSKAKTMTSTLDRREDYYPHESPGQHNDNGAATSGGLWDDDTIVGARITRNRIVFEGLISRGGYGEVYAGTYDGERVAIKMLLPERRKQIRHVNDFLAEVKLMAGLEHPRVVQFIGVAWDSLTNLCVVVEFMSGGDLRSMLNQFEASNHPLGFDFTKLQIAMHIAHALTYLHSLQPMIIHRDLKSRNVLLDGELNAKLTDFGVSRERMDATMTAGVGTSLWMAPEIMLGGKYDEKADVFSFGVMLSELDQHGLPYASAKDSMTGRKLPDTAILQLVILEKLRVEFSPGAQADVVSLGEACVRVDPTARPTSAEVLYKLHSILRSMT
jgi:serine/threonine-protein kinase TNNI3K